MARRRYRPTFLLQVVVLCGSAAAFAFVVALLTLTPLPLTSLTVALLVALVVGWFVAVDLLPEALERWLTHRAEAAARPAPSLWFVDRRAEESRAREDRAAEVRDNPALW